MIDLGKASVLGVEVSVIDYDAAVARIIEAAKSKRPLGVTALAVHGVMTGALDASQRFRLNALDVVTPDGQPVRWALRLLYNCGLRERVYGPDLMLTVCEAAEREGLSIYCYGSRTEVLDALVRNLRRAYPRLQTAGSQPSEFRQLTEPENVEMADRIASSGADIVFVGIGCPRQEVFVYENKDLISRPLIAVGAAFDFHAGLLPQAPRWMQNRGLEWAFRLWHEPRRLWRRYLVLNPLYVWMVANQKLGKTFGQPVVEPDKNVRFG